MCGCVSVWVHACGVQISVLPWFTADTKFGCLSVHLESPQCFSAEIYATDLNVEGAPEDLKVTGSHCPLRGLSGPSLQLLTSLSQAGPSSLQRGQEYS